MTISDLFRQQFGLDSSSVGRANGRVNLIGEHLDYNGGLVLPAPISRCVEVAILPTGSKVDEIYSESFKELHEAPITDVATKHWSDYVVGALSKCRDVGALQGGVKAAIRSDIPPGAGVSSSAAVIVATIRAVYALHNDVIETTELAKLAQNVEHDYIGMPCGIMDQMAVSAADYGSALALDTNSLDYDLIDLPSEHHFAVMFSGVTRKLDEGRYAVRREECEQASAQLDAPLLCQIDETTLLMANELPQNLLRRTRHVVSEQKRVIDAIEALRTNNIPLLGNLFNESHISMRDDFEISTPEVDEVVKSAMQFGAVGARMTGGGFGGCIVACVPTNKLDEWVANMEARHKKAKYIC